MPREMPENLKEATTIFFQSSMGKACKYKKGLEILGDEYRNNLRDSELNFHIKTGAIGIRSGIDNISYLNKKEKKLIVENRIKIMRSLYPNEPKDSELVLGYGSYWDDPNNNYGNFYEKKRAIWWKETEYLRTLIILNERKQLAAKIEILRQSGDENWQLYSRWNNKGVGDLRSYFKKKSFTRSYY